MRKPQQKNHYHLIGYCGVIFAALLILTGCGSSRKAFNPNREYPKAQLQEDYRLFRAILEESHPSLYWYTSKDSLDYYFDRGYSLIGDSMTEPQFRTVLGYVIAKIDCGHTSVKYSKNYAHYMDTARLGQFPLGLKFWDDTVAVYSNLNRRDSQLTRGTIITAIEGMPMVQVRDSLFQYMVTDGYSINHKYQTLSNLGNFGLLFQSVFGPREKFNVSYVDKQGVVQSATVGLYDVRKDTLFRRFVATQKKISKKQSKRNRLFNTRSLQVDTAGNTAYMTVNTFTNGNKLKSFFRQSFSYLDRARIKNLIIDVRTNGGGNVGLSTKLSQYLSDHKFKIADSLYAVKKMSKYERHIENSFAGFFFMNLMTRKRSDGKYHFGYFERHYFKPKAQHRYTGNVYILTGGNSFSATTLLVNVVKGQSNVKIAGEETGGGAYGNTAWFIPDVTLPNTGVRFRLPKFHMVMNRNYVKNGRGIVPDIIIKPSVEGIRRGVDVKAERVKGLIEAGK